MSPIVTLLIASVFTIVGALAFWVSAEKRHAYKETKTYLNKVIQERNVALMTEAELALIGTPSLESEAESGYFNTLTHHSPIEISIFGLVSYLIFAACLGIGAYVYANLTVAIIALGVFLILSFLYIQSRANKNKARLVQQLPSFLESMVRLLAVGNSLTASFQNSLESVDKPLKPVLEKVSALLYSGQNFDDALHIVAKQYQIKELKLIASVISIALQYGGRSDQVLQRMSNFMRDLEQARMELHALSAEVRLSAWILALMPLALAGAILVINNSLLVDMWYDPTGRTMLYIAAFLQTSGSFWLYRMAKSI